MMRNQCLWINRARKAAVLIGVLLISMLLHAQDEDSTDTADGAKIVVGPSEGYGEIQNDYFLPKWMTGGVPDSLHLRTLDDTLLTAIKQDKDFWYANTVFEKKKKKAATEKGEARSGSDFWEALLWLVIIGGFIAFLFIYLSNSNVTLFRRNKMITLAEESVETDDIFAINYQKEIDKAVSAGNHRLAVRLLYLQLLRTLSDKKIIQYKQDRTNFDYLLQVNHQTWYQHFFRLTRNYEYVWYGQFVIDRENFDTIKKDFKNLEGKL